MTVVSYARCSGCSTPDPYGMVPAWIGGNNPPPIGGPCYGIDWTAVSTIDATLRPASGVPDPHGEIDLARWRLLRTAASG
jgi:hypothetical protein